MKKFTVLVALACMLAACEKWNGPVKTGNPNTDFSTHILNGYFVKAIGFDSKGNAWIGTSKRSAREEWCSAYGGFAVYNGKDWIVDNTTFTQSGVFTIEQAPDKGIWIGTGDGVYINK